MKILSIWVLGFLSLASFASPPTDLAGSSDLKRPKARPITEDDLVYTDNIKSDESTLKEAARILFDVPGRKLPSRGGKIIFSLKADDLVKILRESKDGRWVGVEMLLGAPGKPKKRAWVPKNSVKPPDPAAAAGDEPDAKAKKNAPGESPAPQDTNVPNL